MKSCGGMITLPNKNQKCNKPPCRCEQQMRQLLNGKCRSCKIDSAYVSFEKDIRGISYLVNHYMEFEILIP